MELPHSKSQHFKVHLCLVFMLMLKRLAQDYQRLLLYSRFYLLRLLAGFSQGFAGRAAFNGIALQFGIKSFCG